jgi:Icc-related predicted phosphoesterase
MTGCLFVSDLHGKIDRYEKLFNIIKRERPLGVFLGGDILPPIHFEINEKKHPAEKFISDYFGEKLRLLKEELNRSYPYIFIIFGNDDEKTYEDELMKLDKKGLCCYAHNRQIDFEKYKVFGYSFIPPSPFRLKDWERYDVSRYVDPGSVSPEEGVYTVERSPHEKKYSTIKEDLELIAGDKDLRNTIFLFHSPPYKTNLDRAPLDGVTVDHVPLDPHIGSIAIRRFIEERQPLLTLHGHAHESSELTGYWTDRIGATFCFSAAHNGKELAVIRFSPEVPETANRELI